MQHNDKDRSLSNKIVELSMQALLAEYNSIRGASLSRDQIIGNLDNFVFVIFSALIIGYPLIVDRGYNFIFLIVSIVISAITLTRIGHFPRLLELANYEEKLRERLLDLMSFINEADYLPQAMEGLWQWQVYRQQQDSKGFRGLGSFRALVRGGMWHILFFSSIGLIILFFALQGFTSLPVYEIILSIIAITYAIILFIAFLVELNFFRGLFSKRSVLNSENL